MLMKNLFMALCILLTPTAFAALETTAPSVLIKSDALHKRAMSETMTVYGSVMPAIGATENISFQRAGQITHLWVVAGQTVERGLALLDYATDPSVTAGYHLAKTTVVFARSELKRVEDLTAHQLATQSQLAAARKALQDALANLAAQNNIGAGVKTQHVSAPFDGVVSQLTVQQGNRVLAGMPIMQLSKSGKLRATLGVEPEDIARLRIGMPVKIASVFGHQISVTARLLQIHGVINPLTRLVDVDVELQGATRGLLNGMQVRGTIILNIKDAWVVQRSAVLSNKSGHFLFQVRNGHAIRVPVTVLIENGNNISVSGALEDSLKVVVSGNYELQDGMTVRERKP